MAVFTNDGRASFTQLLKDHYTANPRSVLIGCGNGLAWWGANQAEFQAFADDGAGNDVVNATYAPVQNLVVKSQDGATLYEHNTDYILSPTTGLVTRVPTGSIGSNEQVQLNYTAGVPAAARSSQTLEKPVGYVAITGLDYVLPLDEVTDPEATFVEVEDVKYAFVSEPSRMLLARARLKQGDAVGDPIREYGAFIFSEVDAALPPGQQFYEPAEVVDKGKLSVVRTRTPVPHDGTISLDINLIIEI